ncbi:MAG: 16S rRNA (adenine(1518)-N(6)/adenine(1519)-N(6))-dimethyltransferase [Alphaproteobacteria bacterium]|nr:16S rRNA (adenine(1518)-N(6)/adenine(1519)-N(6))-dimethyltransferase [Alphaproteobacteria bacterium]
MQTPMQAIEALPPLREVIAAAGLQANKRLGQNFILDLNLTRKIARQLGDVPLGAVILEIGSGPGGLTRALLLETPGQVLAIEKDPRAVAALQPLVLAAGGRLRIVEGDALEDLEGVFIKDADGLLATNPGRVGLSDCGESLSSQKDYDIKNKKSQNKGGLNSDFFVTKVPRYVAANLPYNVGTAILIQLLSRAAQLDTLVLMFQREVAERLVARPGNKIYGRLAILAQAVCAVELCFNLPPSAFVPPPKITSSVVRLCPHPHAAMVPLAALGAVTAAAFGQRRKMLRSSLAAYPLLVAALEEQGMATRRAEELDVAEYLRLAALYQQGGYGSIQA